MQDTSERRERGTELCREKGTELYEVHQSLQNERLRYYDLLIRLAGVSFKLKKESPTPSTTETKELSRKEPDTGLVSDFSIEASLFSSQNETLQALVNKFESII